MMNLMKKTGIAAAALLLSSMAFAEPAGTYQFDKKGAHQFVMFKISHLGYSWLYGRFNDFNGTFTVDAENPENSKVEATIQTASVDSNHAERDKHLRSDDFLDVDKYPTATFKSTSIEQTGDLADDRPPATAQTLYPLRNGATPTNSHHRDSCQITPPLFPHPDFSGPRVRR